MTVEAYGSRRGEIASGHDKTNGRRRDRRTRGGGLRQCEHDGIADRFVHRQRPFQPANFSTSTVSWLGANQNASGTPVMEAP